MRIRALNIRHPWAALVVAGRKTIECRDYPVNHRGLVVIVASVTRPSAAVLAQSGVSHAELDPYPYGHAIGVVELVNVRRGRCGDELRAFCKTQGAWAWELETPREIEPFPVAGRCGLYSIEVPWVDGGEV